MQNLVTPFTYWRKRKTCDETGLSASTIYRLEKQGNFPKRFLITTKLIAYKSTEVLEWMASRKLANNEGGVK